MLMDADVLYDPALLARLVRRTGSALTLDRGFVPGEEPVKVCLSAGRVVEFGKLLPPGLAYDTWGESVGFFRLAPAQATDLAQRVERMVGAGERARPYEDAVREEIGRAHV